MLFRSTNTPPGGWPSFSNRLAGLGITVANGAVTSASIKLGDLNTQLTLDNTSTYLTELISFAPLILTRGSNNLVFTPAGSPPAAVPGPLPVVGAGAAFGWSRQLRRRLKTTA